MWENILISCLMRNTLWCVWSSFWHWETGCHKCIGEHLKTLHDHLCDLVVRVPGYRSGGPGFNSRHYQILWEVLGLERSPLSLVSTIEELLGRNSSGSSLEIWDYGRRDPLSWPCNTFYPEKLALTSQAIGGSSIGTVCSQTKAMEFSIGVKPFTFHYKLNSMVWVCWEDVTVEEMQVVGSVQKRTIRLNDPKNQLP
jgi:hypothetical protein